MLFIVRPSFSELDFKKQQKIGKEEQCFEKIQAMIEQCFENDSRTIRKNLIPMMHSRLKPCTNKTS